MNEIEKFILSFYSEKELKDFILWTHIGKDEETTKRDTEKLIKQYRVLKAKFNH